MGLIGLTGLLNISFTHYSILNLSLAGMFLNKAITHQAVIEISISKLAQRKKCEGDQMQSTQIYYQLFKVIVISSEFQTLHILLLAYWSQIIFASVWDMEVHGAGTTENKSEDILPNI